MENNNYNNTENNPVKSNRGPYLFAVSLAVILVVTIISTSYAFFTASVTGNANNTVITTGQMAIDFTDGPEVGLNSALPGQYIEKTFSVTNSGTVDTFYDIYLSDLLNNFADKSDLVYTLTSNDGGQNISETQMPDVSSKIVSSKSLPVNTTHNYILRVDFKETNDVQDDNKGKTFSTTIRINEVQDAPKPYTIVSGDLDTIGSVVKIANEEFYVIGQEDSNHVKLLSKWNLNVGNNTQVGEQGIQNSLAIGTNNDPSTSVDEFYPATVAFSSTNYWYDGSALKSEYGSSYPAYVYDSNASIKTYVDTYVTYLTNQGANVSGRLIKQEELVALGCNAGGNSCSSAPAWVNQTSYWTGSANNNSSMYIVESNGYINNTYYGLSALFGVRPVIILEK